MTRYKVSCCTKCEEAESGIRHVNVHNRHNLWEVAKSQKQLVRQLEIASLPQSGTGEQMRT